MQGEELVIVFCVEGVFEIFDVALADGGVDVHRCGDVGVAEGILQFFDACVFLYGDRSVAVAELMGGAIDTYIALILCIDDIIPFSPPYLKHFGFEVLYLFCCRFYAEKHRKLKISLDKSFAFTYNI